jgi:hypothetical protein
MDAFALFLIAFLYLSIIIVPKRPKKNLRTILTQDVTDIQKENFVDYLNYERERRKQLRETGQAEDPTKFIDADPETTPARHEHTKDHSKDHKRDK